MSKLNENEREGLILKYTQLIIKKYLRKERITPDEQKELDKIPKKLNMHHRDIIIEAFTIMNRES